MDKENIKNNIKPGILVKIIEKQNQRSGNLTEGIVKEVLTKSADHPYGIKVLLENGAIGRVKEIINSIDKDSGIKKPTDLVEQKSRENQNLEYKSSFRFDVNRFKITGEKAPNKNVEKEIVKTLAAFANAEGGTLYVGVDDDGSVLGLEGDYDLLKKPGSDRFEVELKNSLKSYFKNKLIFDHIKIDFPVMQEKEICTITVTLSPKPIILHDDGKPKYYVRIGNSSEEYEPEDFFEYWEKHNRNVRRSKFRR